MKTTSLPLISLGIAAHAVIGTVGVNTALAKGRTPPVREIELKEPTEFCNSLGCLKVRPGKIQVYDFAKPQLMAGELAEDTRVLGVQLPRYTPVRLRHENPEGEDYDIHVESCALRVNPYGGVRFPSFHIAGGEETCFDTLTGGTYDTTVEGKLSGRSQLNLDGFPLQDYKPVRVAYDRGSLQSSGEFKGKLLSATVGRDFYYQTQELAIRLKQGDRIELQQVSDGTTHLNVSFDGERAFSKGLSGGSPIYDLNTGALVYFAAGSSLSINGMQVEPRTSVAMYPNGAPRSAVPRNDMVQRVNNLDVGSVGDPHWDYPVYFWPNGAVMWATVSPTTRYGIRVTDFQFVSGSLNQIYWLDAYMGHLGFNPDGELRLLAFRRVNENTTTQVRLSKGTDMVPITDELVQQGITPYGIPNEAVVRFLSSH